MVDGMRIMSLLNSLPRSLLQRLEVRGHRVVPLTALWPPSGPLPPTTSLDVDSTCMPDRRETHHTMICGKSLDGQYVQKNTQQQYM
jgi:hypothetical protein